MEIIVPVILALHVLSGVFWAGSTFALARSGSSLAGELLRPQMAAAAVAVITGGGLWHMLHSSVFGTQEQVLAVGALAAVLAAGVQGAVSGRALRKLAKTGGTDAQLRGQVALGYRIAAGLLALTVVCMATARYA